MFEHVRAILNALLDGSALTFLRGLHQRYFGLLLLHNMSGGFLWWVGSVFRSRLPHQYGSCPAFQRFAVRTSKRIENISNMAAQKKQEFADQMKDLLTNFENFKNQ
ncbi:hypothetical protein LOK49_LG05G00241 [Camellia lanceoleosa]|uniref:Uncharacterized protein n=1 Tax=Camellia lanceoleosa TaxID=1840588 RepID=A0ACC0HJD3_9ERIC|nr:hypothetical protein LOK49_LG05G00241 [Camellia lanceoleosa]